MGVGELRNEPAGHCNGSVPAAAQACLKEVQGGLDEVIGLTVIKQARAAECFVGAAFSRVGVASYCLPVAIAPPSTHKPTRRHSPN